MRKIFIILILLAGIAVVYKIFVSPKTAEEVSQNIPAMQKQNEGAEIIQLKKSDELMAGGSSYSDSNANFSILYPNDYQIDTTDKAHIRIFKRGKMDRPQGEITNGVLIVFEPLQLKSSLSDYMKEISLPENQSDTNLISEQSKIILNDYPGFLYHTKGFGESTVFLLQKDKNSKFAISVSILVNDPENVGYQKEVDSILASLTLFK